MSPPECRLHKVGHRLVTPQTAGAEFGYEALASDSVACYVARKSNFTSNFLKLPHNMKAYPPQVHEEWSMGFPLLARYAVK